MTGGVIRAWYQASRAPFFVATLIPLVLGGMLASVNGVWDGGRWLAVLLASFFVHLNTNLANDYFEYFSGADAGESIGGSRVLQEGKITLGQIKIVMIILYMLACAIGLWLVWISRVWWLLGVMGFSFFSSIFYTARPIRYGYHGLGELFVGINMGPVMVVGTYAALGNSFSWDALWLSLPVGIMVAMILYYQSLPDIDTDQRVGKLTLAVRFGRKRAIWGYRLFAVAAILAMILAVIARLVHPLALLTIFTIIPVYRMDRIIDTTGDWVALHGRGGPVRGFYFMNGVLLILGVALN